LVTQTDRSWVGFQCNHSFENKIRLSVIPAKAGIQIPSNSVNLCKSVSKNRIGQFWLVISRLAIVVLSANIAAALPGSGTQEDPWRIESLADFDEFASDPNYWSGFTRLETDVNLAGRIYSTAVIAPDVNNSSWWFDGTAFAGIFDGNDHKIIGLTIDDSGAGSDYLGLFGFIGEDGQVRNLGIESGSVRGDYYVGGLVGMNYYGSISNCYSTGYVSGYSEVGGLVGANGGSVPNCYSTGDVNGVGDVGGLVGFNYDRVSNCYSTGDVNGVAHVGGLVGGNLGTVSNCYSTGSVTGDDNVGGLVGKGAGSILNCYSTGEVSGGRGVGGLVGSNTTDGTISDCYSTGSVTGTDYVGGLVGDNYGSVSNCYSTVDVNGADYVGGLVGGNGFVPRYIPGYISNSYSTGSVQGASCVGGLVGYNECGDIDISFWDVATSGEPNMCGYQEEEYATACDPNCGKTTAQMQTRSTFIDAGWDFVEIWLINNGATYPVLRQEIRSDLNGDGGVNLLDFAVFADHWLEGKDN